MSRTLKVTGNHVMYDRGAWFLRVIMSSSRALCCLPSVKKQKHDFQVCFVDRARHRKSSWRQGLTNTKRSTKVAKELFADYVKEKKLREPEEKKELAQTLKTCYVEARKKGFVQCIIKQLLDSVFVISRIIKVSVRVISLSLPRPWFFWISQKPHPIIVYYYVFRSSVLLRSGLYNSWTHTVVFHK